MDRRAFVIGIVAGALMALWSLRAPSGPLMASVTSAVRPVKSGARLLRKAAKQVGHRATARIPLVTPRVERRVARLAACGFDAPASTVGEGARPALRTRHGPLASLAGSGQPGPTAPVTPSFAWPVDGEVSSCYGERWGRIHVGLDIAARDGANVMAARDGRVVWSGWMPGYGNMLLVEHERGWYTVYGHNQRHLVEATGDGRALVRAGQPIALVGRTGNATGPHVHFEIRKGIDAVDPLTILPARFQTASR